MLAVVTADQRGSRRGVDRVPAVLSLLNTAGRTSPYRSFERTAGDEVQGVLSRPDDVVDAVERLTRAGGWSIGIGIGPVEQPLPRSTRAGRGAAFLHARRAVDAAKNHPTRLAVVADPLGPEDVPVRRVETALMLWADLLGRRTPRGWEVADLVAAGLTHVEISRRLEISASAVSQRAAAAGVTLSVRGRTLATELLVDLMGGDR